MIDSRSQEDSKYRRRECLECKNRFNTAEIDADYYETLKPINKAAIYNTLEDSFAEITKMYRALMMALE